MRKFLIALAAVALSAAVGDSGPVTGRVRLGQSQTVDPIKGLELRNRFKANERACVIIEGDHSAALNLGLFIFDQNKQEVAHDVGGTFLGAAWVPPREGDYVIQVKLMQPSERPTRVSVVLK